MSYGLYPELFSVIEKKIDQGLYKEAQKSLESAKHRTLQEHALFADILAADINSHQGRFSEALTLQKNILKKLPDCDLQLQEIAVHSHAFTLGYTGKRAQSYSYFRKAQTAARKLHLTARYYASALGMVDIEFHNYECKRFIPDHNRLLLGKIDDELLTIKSQKDFAQKEFYVAMFSFRKAILLWLNGSYAVAEPLFELVFERSSTFFRTWALFGLAYCACRLKKQRAFEEYKALLKKPGKEAAWNKNARRYWPVALLLGRTWELMGDVKKAQEFYQTILLTVRKTYTEGSLENTSYITEYFYPVYQESMRYLIGQSHEYRYALNRAEMFRARFLTEEYKRHYGKKTAGILLSPNMRINVLGHQLSGIFKKDVMMLYCFDFNDSGMLLLSRDLENYIPFQIPSREYACLQRLTSSKFLTPGTLDEVSSIFNRLLAEIRTSRLIVVPHGIFNSVPFHALARKNKPLINRTVVSYWPSLQMAALGEQGVQNVSGATLFIGTGSDPASRREIKLLASGKDSFFYDPRLEKLERELQAGYGITHFVTHGAVDGSHQDLTLIKFKWGSLKVSDLAGNLHKISPVIALNICYGGHMIHDSAEFLKGLPVTLFQKGALTVIVSSCEVEQETSRMFYKRFYINLGDGLTLGEAYRKAILDADNIENMLVNAPRIMGTCDIIVEH